MKKHNRITAVLMLILSATCLLVARSIAQPNLGLYATNKGVGFSAGIVNENIVLNFSCKVPLFKNDVPTIVGISGGYDIKLWGQDDGKIIITPTIGVGNYRVKDYTAYDADPTGKAAVRQINNFKPLYGLEVGSQWYCGRLFLSASYCGGFSAGIGIKVFTHQLNY